MEPDFDLQPWLDAAGRRLKADALLRGVCWWLSITSGVWLSLFALDNLFNLPAGFRFPLALGGFVWSALSFYQRVLRIALRRQKAERTALLLEQHWRVPDNLLINALQFQSQNLRPEERPFARQTIALSRNEARRFRLETLWNRGQLSAWGAWAALALIVWIFYAALFPRHLFVATIRYVLPLGDAPPAAELRLTLSPASDVTLAEGESLPVLLRVERNSRHLAKPPVIVWEENADFVRPDPSAGETIAMDAAPDARGVFQHTFADAHAPFAFRVFAGESYTRSIRVRIEPLPKITSANMRLVPPAYTGLAPANIPGPPAPISALPGSRLELDLQIAPEVSRVIFNLAGREVPLRARRGHWQAAAPIERGGAYAFKANYHGPARLITVAQGDVNLLTDNPPEVDFVTDDRNRAVELGSRIALTLAARDDFGLQEIAIALQPADDPSAMALLKRWNYLGPPGNRGPTQESYSLEIDPRRFELGRSYLLLAMARDFRPGADYAKSSPLLLRVKSLDDTLLSPDDPLAGAFSELKKTAAQQQKANHLTVNLETYLDEAIQKKSAPDQRRSMRAEQQQAQYIGRGAWRAFRAVADGREYAALLESLVEGEMSLALRGIQQLPEARADLAPALAQIERRQSYILAQLLELLGKIAERRKPAAPDAAKADAPAPLDATQAAQDLAVETKKFLSDQERVLERSKTLLDKTPQDLTAEDQQALGELARDEAEWAKFFEEKLTDFSKLPLQDFADGSLAKEVNSVYQEIKAADESLYAQKTELAVPHEQSGLENAKEILNNLERWLPDTPDRTKWNMEEPLNPADVAMAELPDQLEDIVGDLLDKEQDMTKDVEDVSSSWMDSADKGAGWDAMDGPISNMSAKGVTGNLLPNNDEIGGRSGEGRSGRSDGQMVADSAQGKGGRETPTRLTPTPFEQGAVNDSDTSGHGGATGGGKLSGSGAEGLRGPTSSAAFKWMPRLAQQQTKIRQQAEVIALKLRQLHLPSGDMETSIQSMRRLEQAAHKNDGLAVRQAFARALDSLGQATSSVRAAAGVRRETNHLPGWMRQEIRAGAQDGVPRGYEEMVSEYFRKLAQSRPDAK